MSRCSTIRIDRLYLEYEYEYPSYLTFLFEPADFFAERNEHFDLDDWENKFEALGYKTSCRSALVTLDRYGYTLEFFADVYLHFRPQLEAAVESRLVDEVQSRRGRDNEAVSEIEAERRVRDYLSRLGNKTAKEELRDFIGTLKEAISTEFDTPPFNQPYVNTRLLNHLSPEKCALTPQEYLQRWRRGDIVSFEIDKLESYISNHFESFPPAALLILDLLSFGDFPEILSLLYARCALEAATPDAPIVLDVSDMTDSEEEARGLHASIAYSLVEKVQLYNRVYQNLFTSGTVRSNFVRSKSRELLKECQAECNSNKKGKLLEELTELIFTTNNSLEVIDKRISTGDEEIDILIKNNVERPFWIAFNSPTIFVECKNWSSNVGAAELRDFEGKLRNHSAVTKLGFFVSLNGFSREVYEELKRAGRDNYHIALLTGEHLRDFATSEIDFFNWLERRLAALH